MTPNQQTILACMDMNIRNARTPKLREFYEANRASFLAEIRRRAMRGRAWGNPMERFGDSLCR